MRAKLYGIPGSHPVRAAQLMLDHKGIEWDQVDVPTVLCRPFLRARGFPGPTVPAMVLDGPQGPDHARDLARRWTRSAPTRRCSRPTPTAPLRWRTPSAGATRCSSRCRAGSPWRRWCATPPGMASFLERPLLGMPPRLVEATAKPIIAASRRINKADDDAIRRDLAALPGMLDRVDELIAEGTIGGGRAQRGRLPDRHERASAAGLRGRGGARGGATRRRPRPARGGALSRATCRRKLPPGLAARQR